jgi:hypothetical protein
LWSGKNEEEIREAFDEFIARMMRPRVIVNTTKVQVGNKE